MRKNIFNQDGLFFIPLGGCEEFGINFNLYILDGQLLVVDCGVGFADETMPGIEILLPDSEFVEKNTDKLKGLIVTHAHEDHVGGVAYLWDRFGGCPLYATKFTAEILRRKLEEQGHKHVPIQIVEPMSRKKIGVFDVQFVPVSHSVPQSCALMIRTDYGNILHSGDWNLDPTPVIDQSTDEQVFRALGDEKILAYIGDSTNAQVKGRAGSERDAEAGLLEEFKNCKGRIAVTAFSSNISRILSVAKSSAAAGRKVGLVGRSLHRMVSAAHECGYLDDVADFVSEEELVRLPDNKVVMIVTGSQGEGRAALAKIASGSHRAVKLSRGDTVIFSARSIPGNEININSIKNNLSAAGVRVVGPDDTDHIIHVSGHPCRGEIDDMFSWLRPACVIPVHGERSHLQAHADLALSCQVPQALLPNNGSVIRLGPGEIKVVDSLEVKGLVLDQNRIIPANHKSIAERRKLQYTGAVHVSMVLDRDYRVLAKVKLDIIGLDVGPDRDLKEKDIIEEALDCLPREGDPEDWLEDEIAEEIRIGLRRYIEYKLGLKPKTTVHIMIVDE